MRVKIFQIQSRFIYRHRYAINFAFFCCVLIGCIILSRMTSPLNQAGFNDPSSESYLAVKHIERKFGYGENRFVIFYKSDTWSAYDPAFIAEVRESLSALKKLPFEHQIIYPYLNTNQISPDKHTAYVVILLKGTIETNPEIVSEIMAQIKKPPHLSMLFGGGTMFADEAKKIARTDLFRAEYIATPAALLAMIIVFGTVVAGVLPVITGMTSVIFTVLLLYLIGNFFNLSIFSMNIAALLSLGLNLDYALFFVSRFREELIKNVSMETVLQRTAHTAGKAIFFSALAVIISLSALLLFQINFLVSVGIGGIVGTLSSAFVAIFFLPAVLSIVGKNINRLPIKLFPVNIFYKFNFWQRLLENVLRHSRFYFFGTVAIILFLSFPVLQMKLNLANPRMLPKNSASYQSFELLQKKFGEDEFPIIIAVSTPQKSIVSPDNVFYLYDFVQNIASDPRVKRIESIVTNESRLTKYQMQEFYDSIKDNTDNLNTIFRQNMTLISIFSRYPANATETIQLVHKLRRSNPGNGMTLEVTGFSANLIDVFSNIEKTLPYAVVWILLFSYLALLLLFRSLFLPLKAIFMNLLSLSASYGALVLVFQKGYLQYWFNFEAPGWIELTSVIVIFCALFGVSMDYEVFMLSRIKECFEKNRDNHTSIIEGTTRSGKVITSAAAVLILVCLSFLSADVVLVKAFGFGVAAAVFVDAFLIRIFLVPATMSLLEKWNWYLPRWLDNVLPQISFHHDETR